MLTHTSLSFKFLSTQIQYDKSLTNLYFYCCQTYKAIDDVLKKYKKAKNNAYKFIKTRRRFEMLARVRFYQYIS